MIKIKMKQKNKKTNIELRKELSLLVQTEGVKVDSLIRNRKYVQARIYFDGPEEGNIADIKIGTYVYKFRNKFRYKHPYNYINFENCIKFNSNCPGYLAEDIPNKGVVPYLNIYYNGNYKDSYSRYSQENPLFIPITKKDLINIYKKSKLDEFLETIDKKFDRRIHAFIMDGVPYNPKTLEGMFIPADEISTKITDSDIITSFLLSLIKVIRK